MTSINLFGAGGHAKVVMDIIKAEDNRVSYLYDDAPNCGHISGIPVYKASEAHVEGPMIVCIGSCKARRLISERYDVAFASAIHPSAIISDSVSIGEGTVIMPGAVVNAETKIGRHCILNTNSSVDHECRIGDFVHIAPGCAISGNVTIGEGTWIGIGSCINQGIKIGRNSVIGAGSVVVKDIPDNVVAYGCPCRPIRQNE